MACSSPQLLSPSRFHPRSFKMIFRESEQLFNFGRGAYDTTGVPKPQPPKPQ